MPKLRFGIESGAKLCFAGGGDNTEPWLPHPPRALAECMWISDQSAKEVEEWGPKSQLTSS